MYDPAPDSADRPLTRSERWIYLGFAVFLLGCYAAEVATRFEPVKLSILFVLLAWAPLLVLHEAGHAVAAHVLGWRLDGIHLGFGRVVGRRRVWGVEVEVRALPVEGFVRCRPRDLTGVRWKSALIYFAGPGVELLFALALLGLAGGDVLLTRSDSVGVVALQSVALASVLGAVLNLLPHSTFGPDGEVASDGLGILQSLTTPPEAWAAALRRKRFFHPDED